MVARCRLHGCSLRPRTAGSRSAPWSIGGWRRHASGPRGRAGGDIVTSRPVADIVGEALLAEVTKNRHAVVSDRPDIVLSAAVEAFRLDAVDGYSSFAYVGKVVIALTVADGRTGDILLTRRYVGIKRRETDKPDESQWRAVMDVALARTMRDLATDPDLVGALARVPTAAQAAPADLSEMARVKPVTRCPGY